MSSSQPPADGAIGTAPAAAALLPSRRFALPAAPAAEQRARYREHVGDGWRADFIDEGVHPAESRLWNLGSVVVTQNDFPARRVVRTRALARADQLDHYEVRLTLAGMQIETERGQVRIEPSSLVVLDLGLPFDAFTGAGESIQVFLPRELLDEQLTVPRSLHATALHGPVAGLLGDFLRTMVGRLPSMTVADAAEVSRAATQLVAASAAATPATFERAAPALQASLLRQACRYIELHLQEPDLDAARVGRALGLSRSALYRLFEPYGGIAAHVIERRLHRIRDVLAGPSAERSLGRLAEQHGFKTAAHFSRAFRRQFGITPSQARGIGPAGAASSGAAAASGHSLAAWLRPLRG